MYRLIFICLYTIVVIAATVKSEPNIQIDLICSKIETMSPREDVTYEQNGIFTTLRRKSYVNRRFVSSNLVIESSTSILDKVLHPNGTELSQLDIDNIDFVKIESVMKSVKFIPAGIKKKFTKMIGFEVINSGLVHIEKDDMRQFGADLIHVDFFGNSLSALDGDLFQFNPKLKIIYFAYNSIKFIESSLFQNFKSMINIKMVNFWSCYCINEGSNSDSNFFTTSNWNWEKCNALSVQKEHQNIVNKRVAFFSRIYPEIAAEKLMIQTQEISDLKEDIKTSQWKISHLEYKIDTINNILKGVMNFVNNITTVIVLVIFLAPVILIIFVCKNVKRKTISSVNSGGNKIELRTPRTPI